MTLATRRRLLFVGLLAASLWPVSFDARIVLWCLAAHVLLGGWT